MQEPIFDLTRPIVIRGKKGKKRKYSRGLRDLQITGRRMSKISSRMVRSVSKGMDAYRSASDKSARKKRDGALLDFNRNAAKGITRALRESSRIPFDLAKSMDTRGRRRAARRQTRALARFSRALGIR